MVQGPDSMKGVDPRDLATIARFEHDTQVKLGLRLAKTDGPFGKIGVDMLRKSTENTKGREGITKRALRQILSVLKKNI